MQNASAKDDFSTIMCDAIWYKVLIWFMTKFALRECMHWTPQHLDKKTVTDDFVTVYWTTIAVIKISSGIIVNTRIMETVRQVIDNVALS